MALMGIQRVSLGKRNRELTLRIRELIFPDQRLKVKFYEIFFASLVAKTVSNFHDYIAEKIQV